MAIIEKQTPHEFLARWDDAGSIQGAHIAYRTAWVDDTTNTEVASKFGDPQPVDLTNATLLSQISADINQSTLTDNTAKAAQIADLTTQVATANTATDTAQAAQTQAQADRDAALAQVQALQAQLAAYQTPTVNGVPQAIHKWQVMVGLGKDGIRDSVMAFITTLSQAAQDLWAESTMVERSSPLFAIAESKLGWTSAQIDDMFTRYNAITLADITA